MKFGSDFFRRYLKQAPLPLALERSLECKILSKQEFRHPVLDIGCGDGLFAHILSDEKIDLGIDPKKSELDRAKKYAIYEELIQCFGSNIPKEDRSFNTIYSNSALEHVSDLEPVLTEVHRLLSDDGGFYITVPTDLFEQYTIVNMFLTKLRLESMAKRYRILYNRFWAQYHHYPAQEWINLFEKNGFRVVQTTEYGSKKICLFNDFLVPFSILSWFTKKMFNRWTLFPAVRTLITYPISLLISRKEIEQAISVNNGGLIFFELRKKMSAGY
jgi:SAM-dependent methyltransferase